MSTPIAVEAPQPQRRDAENAGPAAVVEHRVARHHVALEPGEAQSRGRMAAGAECGTRIEDQVHGARFGGGVPCRHDPDPAAGLDGRELALGLRDPIGFLEPIDASGAHGLRTRPAQGRIHGGRRVGVRDKQRAHATARPCRWVGARFAEYRVLAPRSRVRVGDVHGDRAFFLERIGERRGVSSRHHDPDPLPGHP
jgi:hypothetical protein